MIFSISGLLGIPMVALAMMGSQWSSLSPRTSHYRKHWLQWHRLSHYRTLYRIFKALLTAAPQVFDLDLAGNTPSEGTWRGPAQYRRPE